ncbi:glycoside hydrolase family 3 N-terminal domain-containing protein [Lacticaseibacillus daqingensis]|uniref:glycoside hydrolase family 3 N-terminal domain-containing protein n=1 Tax=Lacticaseibacillus daqingensis TaxID=2486014 RepID=UPI000F773766|nr:glycoside hydrolase family 3 N-terminal domain-containing protein [Lacticaseibacillus daqingensis]
MSKFGRITASIFSTAALVLGALAAPVSSVNAAEVKTGVTDAQIDKYINSLTLSQKVGQMFVLRTPADTEKVKQDVQKYNLGGLIYYAADLQGLTQEQVKAKSDAFQVAAKTPLLIGIDQEGGSVSRLSASGLITDREFPSPQDLYKQGGVDATTKEATEVGTILRSLGVNWNYAPDADVTDDTSAFIFKRTLGQDYQTTADYMKQVVPAWQNAGVAATLKHFPGYGSAIDTHTDFAEVQKSLADFKAQDFLPFKAGIDAGVDSVMIAHIVMTQVDPVYPASLSPKVISLLRNDLGFKGVVITDALEMGAIQEFAKNHDGEEIDTLAVKAGNDCIMNNDYETGIPQVVAAVQKGEISEAQIDGSVKRILQMKNKLGLLSAEDIQTNHISVDNVTYKEDGKTAVITGTIVDSEATTGEPISATDANGKVVASGVIGGEGHYELTVPMTEAEQQLTISTVLNGYDPAQVTIKALAKSPETTDPSTTTNGDDKDDTDANTPSNKPSTDTNKDQTSNKPSGGKDKNTPVAAKNNKTATTKHGFLPQTGEKVATGVAVAGVLVIAAIGAVVLIRKRA